MKNLILFLIALLIFTSGQSQPSSGSARVILNVSEGVSGHHMLLDADATTYNTVGKANTVFVLSYRHFEYTIPVDADRNPATTHTVVNASSGITLPAGSYDYFVIKPTPDQNRLECGIGTLTEARGHHFVFESGKAYRFTVLNEMTYPVIYDVRPMDAPEEPSGFTVTSNASGTGHCTLRWKNPATTIDGTSLTSLTSIVVLRNGRMIEVIANPAPGADGVWTDVYPVAGNHSYTVYATNSAGNGFPVSKTIECSGTTDTPAAGKDAAVVAVTQPVGGKSLTNAENVTVTIKNRGTQPISNVPLRFDINGVPAGNGTYAGSIAAGAETPYTFANTADFSSVRTSWLLKASTALTGDEKPENDAFAVQIDNYGDCRVQTPYSFGFEEDMDFNCWTIYGNEGGDPWKRINKLVSAEPVRTGRCAMIHSWNEGKGWLVSPRISLPATGTVQLSFWSQYFIHTGGYGKSSVWITENADPGNFASYTEIWSPASVPADVWTEAVVDLSAYVNKEVYIAFCHEGITGKYAHRWALDDIRMVRLPDKDAGITAVSAPKSGARLTAAETVTVTVKNFSAQPLDIPVHYRINNGTAVSETIASLGSQQDTVYTFSGKADLAAEGDYTLLVYTGLNGDENPDNDAKTVSVANYGECMISDFPYTYSFENPDSLHCWSVIYPGPVNIPDIEGADIATPHSGDHFWRFTSFYGNGTYDKNYEQYLISPELITGRPKTLEFYYRPSSLWTYEPFKVGYSVTDNAPDSFTWISDRETSRQAWEKYSDIVPGDAKYIAIFFYPHPAFLYIDDIRIDILPESKDAGITQILSPLHGNPEPVPVTVTIRNFGGTPLTSLKLAYRLLDNPPVEETYPGTIDPAVSVEYTFNRKVDLSVYRDDYRLQVYPLLDGDLDHSNDTATVQFIYRPNVQLYGYRVWDDLLYLASMNFMHPVTFYSDDPSQVTEINDYIDGSNVFTASEFLNDTIYAYTAEKLGPGNFIRLTRNWEEISKVRAQAYALDLAYDYTTRTMFATVGSSLRKVDIQTGAMEQIAGTRLFWTLACDLNGQLYGIDENGWFCKIDKKLGTATPLKKQNPMPSRTHQSMAFDHHTGRLFWAMSAEGYRDDGRPMDLGRLYEINPETGEAVNLGSINGAGEAEIVGLYTPYKHQDVSIVLPRTDASEISIYPNPSDGKIRITPVPENAVIQIVDVSGRIVETCAGRSGNVDLDLNLSKGVYFVRMEGKRIEKLIVK